MNDENIDREHGHVVKAIPGPFHARNRVSDEWGVNDLYAVTYAG